MYLYLKTGITSQQESLLIDTCMDRSPDTRVTDHRDRTELGMEGLLCLDPFVLCVSAKLTNSENTQNSLAVTSGATRRVGVVPPLVGLFRKVSEQERDRDEPPTFVTRSRRRTEHGSNGQAYERKKVSSK
jgi:hypothetical protein